VTPLTRLARSRPFTLLVLAAAGLTPVLGYAQAPAPGAAQVGIDKGLAYLKAHQLPDGGWADATEPPAISALALKAFVDSPGPVDSATVDKGFAALLALQKPNGGIYSDGLGNYNTAIAVTALAAVPNGKYKAQIDKAIGYLRSLQWTDDLENAPVGERAKVDKGDPRYGGFGYGDPKHGTRPDGSNVQMALDALHDAGIRSDDPAYAAAVVFESRLQNRSESNDQSWASNDGGFIYSDANGGSSAGGKFTDAAGRTRFHSYGALTYAGLKSMIYAGLPKDDPRVKSAWGWITSHWTFDEVPGLVRKPPATARSGLFYYLHTAARALAAYGEPIVTDAQGNKHDWRAELTAKLLSMQQPDGSWVGENRWMESKPALATSVAVLCLEIAQADQKAHPANR
jgi:squalene-hopene/tetraprenyl-beta-curcumene cyclase